jgi:hypothetical protein
MSPRAKDNLLLLTFRLLKFQGRLGMCRDLLKHFLLLFLITVIRDTVPIIVIHRLTYLPVYKRNAFCLPNVFGSEIAVNSLFQFSLNSLLSKTV